MGGDGKGMSGKGAAEGEGKEKGRYKIEPHIVHSFPGYTLMRCDTIK